VKKVIGFFSALHMMPIYVVVQYGEALAYLLVGGYAAYIVGSESRIGGASVLLVTLDGTLLKWRLMRGAAMVASLLATGKLLQYMARSPLQLLGCCIRLETLRECATFVAAVLHARRIRMQCAYSAIIVQCGLYEWRAYSRQHRADSSSELILFRDVMRNMLSYEYAGGRFRYWCYVVIAFCNRQRLPSFIRMVLEQNAATVNRLRNAKNVLSAVAAMQLMTMEQDDERWARANVLVPLQGVLLSSEHASRAASLRVAQAMGVLVTHVEPTGPRTEPSLPLPHAILLAIGEPLPRMHTQSALEAISRSTLRDIVDQFTHIPLDSSQPLFRCRNCRATYQQQSIQELRQRNRGCFACGTNEFVRLQVT